MTFDVQPAALALVTVALVVTLWWQRRMWRDIHTWLRLTALVLLAGVALQPGFEHASGEEAPTGMDVVLLVDRTTSMAAQDYDGNRPRMEGVAADVEALVGTMPGARYTVVTSDNEARVAAPWTTDGAAVVTRSPARWAGARKAWAPAPTSPPGCRWPGSSCRIRRLSARVCADTSCIWATASRSPSTAPRRSHHFEGSSTTHLCWATAPPRAA